MSEWAGAELDRRKAELTRLREENEVFSMAILALKERAENAERYTVSLMKERDELIDRDEVWRKKKEMLENDLGKAWKEAKTYKRLLDEQVYATNVVTKELNACYAELGIYRHPSEPDRGPDAIKRLRGAVEWACDEKNARVYLASEILAELRKRAGK